MLTRIILQDYLTLCKPRVVFLMLITSWVGMYLSSPNSISITLLISSTIGITFAASAAAIINHLLDREIDLKMTRTSKRPIANGRIHPKNAIWFAIALTILSLIILFTMVNTLTMLLSFATLIGYAFIYTIYLKRATPQNIVIGGLSGAMPPLLGWCAMTGEINSHALLLSLIIFIWTPPHFWALAIYRNQEYKNAKIPMLPVTHGIKYTKFMLLLYTFLLLAVSTLPFVVRMSGYTYLYSSLMLNFGFIYYALVLYFSSGNKEHIIAIKTFQYSIFYLLLLFIVLMVNY